MNLPKKIKSLRLKYGISQEELAENSGLNLRTIQRIENGQNKPTGDSIKKIAFAFNISIEELTEIDLTENIDYLKYINLSALTFLLFPLFGSIFPFIIWILKKDKIRNLDAIGKSLINFQITWNFILFLFISLVIVSNKTKLILIGAGPITLFLTIMYIFNLFSIIKNSLRASRGKKVRYFLTLNFL